MGIIQNAIIRSLHETVDQQAQRITDLERERDEAYERAAQIARTYAQPNRFKPSEQWKEDQTVADVYETAAIDVANWIEVEIRALSDRSKA